MSLSIVNDSIKRILNIYKSTDALTDIIYEDTIYKYTNTVNKDNYDSELNNIFSDTNPNFSFFVSNIQSHHLNKYELLYCFDINVNKFVKLIKNYNGLILSKYTFHIILFEYDTTTYNTLKHQTNTPIFNIFKNINKSTLTLEIIFDDYLNIYLPEIKTLVINNYIKFPLYSLFLLKSCMTYNTICSCNKNNKDDLIKYNQIKKYKDDTLNYLSSSIIRKNINNSIFYNILSFVNYELLLVIINPYLELPHSLIHLTDKITKKKIQELNELQEKYKKLQEENKKLQEELQHNKSIYNTIVSKLKKIYKTSPFLSIDTK